MSSEVAASQAQTASPPWAGPPETSVFPCIMEVGGWALSFHNNSQEWPRPETGAVMGPLLNAILLEVPGSLGEPDDGSALCLGMAGPPKGLETWLSVRLSVRAWLLAPQGSKDSTFSFF